MRSWRRFVFFNKDLVREEGAKAPHPGIQTLDISCASSGRGHLIFGDAEGHITLLDRDYKATKFRAYEQRVTHVAALKHADVLLSIGDGIDPRPQSEREASRQVSREARRKVADRRARDSARDGGASGAGGDGSPELDADADAEARASVRTVATLKVWRMDRRDPRTGEPTCVRTVRALGPKDSSKVREVAITAVAVLEDLTQIALGMADGSIVLLRGEFSRERGGVAYETIKAPAPAAAALAAASHDPSAGGSSGDPGGGGGDGDAGGYNAREAVTFMGFTTRADAFRGGSRATLLYATTLTDVLCFSTTPTGGGLMGQARVPDPTVLDTVGCARGCAVVTDDGNLVVGQNDAVFFFTPEDRDVCYGFSDAKNRLAWFRSYLLVASRTPDGRSAVNVYDLKNKFIAMHLPLTAAAVRRGASNTHGYGRPALGGAAVSSALGKGPASAVGAGGGGDDGPRAQEVRYIVAEWGSIFVVTSQHTVTQLTEKDTTTKLEMLFKQARFDLAISLAKTSDLDDANIQDIFRMYGDYLHKKQEYDRAISQYTHTIGHVEPSYVIRKFLDAQRIHNLTTYLEALHAPPGNHATADHTTLLLNCYTKLKEEGKIKSFIHSKDHSFDVETAIGALRNAGYADAKQDALFLAERHREHKWYLKIQVEDIRDYDTALDYIRRLPLLDAEEHLLAYGKTLVSNRPEKATDLLKKLCTTGADVPPPPAVGRGAAAGTGGGGGGGDGDGGGGSGGGSGGGGSGGGAAATGDGSGSGAAASASGDGGTSGAGSASASATASATSSAAAGAGGGRQALKCNAEDFIPLYDVDRERSRHLKRFLEYIVHHDPEGSSPLVWNTLLELCLTEMAADQKEGKKSKGAKGGKGASGAHGDDRKYAIGPKDIMRRILKNPHASYDVDHALVLVQMHGFKEGQLFLYEKARMYPMVIQHYMEVAATHKAAGHSDRAEAARRTIIQKCKLFGDKDPNLWVQVLTYFAQSYTGTGGGGDGGGDGGGVSGAGGGDGGAATDDDAGGEADAIAEVLNHIDEEHLLPPLLVIQIMAENPDAPLGLVRDYIIRRLREQEAVIEHDAAEIRNFREETEAMKTEVFDLKTKAQIFQAGKCDFCQQDLELPAVHFLCKHSFHQTCLTESEGECPHCSADHNHVLDVTRRLGAKVGDNESFFNELKSSADGFATVAEYFGKGCFVAPEDASGAAGGGGARGSGSGASGAGAGRRRGDTDEDASRAALLGL